MNATVAQPPDNSTPTTAGDVRVGDFIRDIEHDFMGEAPAWAQVRHIEPVATLDNQLLIVFAGATIAHYHRNDSVAIATPDQIAELRKQAEQAERRTAVRAGVARILTAIDDGMPVPDRHYQLSVDGSLESPDKVREAARVLGIEVTERDHPYGPGKVGKPGRIWEARTTLGAVEFRFYYLGSAAEAAS